MAIEQINIGSIANDGTGDELRVAFRKINENFLEVESRLGDAVEGKNIGSGAEVFRGRVDSDLEDEFTAENDLEFRSLVAGNNVSITQNSETIEISASDALNDVPITSDSGTITLSKGEILDVVGGSNISTRVDAASNRLIIDNTKTTNLEEDLSPSLSGNLDAQLFSINNVEQITANNIVGGTISGRFVGELEGFDIDKVTNFFERLDFGTLDSSVSSFYDYFILSVSVDLGTFNTPSNVTIDEGTIV